LISSTTLFGYRAGSTAGNLFFFVVQKTQISTKIQITDVKNDKNKVLQIKYEHLAAVEVTIIICFFEVRFLAALASWLCRLHRFLQFC